MKTTLAILAAILFAGCDATSPATAPSPVLTPVTGTSGTVATTPTGAVYAVQDSSGKLTPANWLDGLRITGQAKDGNGTTYLGIYAMPGDSLHGGYAVICADGSHMLRAADREAHVKGVIVQYSEMLGWRGWIELDIIVNHSDAISMTLATCPVVQ